MIADRAASSSTHAGRPRRVSGFQPIGAACFVRISSRSRRAHVASCKRSPRVAQGFPQGACPDERGDGSTCAGSKSSPQSSHVISLFALGRNGLPNAPRRLGGFAMPPQRGQRGCSCGAGASGVSLALTGPQRAMSTALPRSICRLAGSAVRRAQRTSAAARSSTLARSTTGETSIPSAAESSPCARIATSRTSGARPVSA